MRVLICGSRTWTDREAIETVLHGLWWEDGSITVIAGGALGADAIAEQWARERYRPEPSRPDSVEDLCDLKIYPADWDLHGKGAGPIRNQKMLTEGKPDVVWAFATPTLDQSPGTLDMVARARKAGVPVRVVTPS